MSCANLRRDSWSRKLVRIGQELLRLSSAAPHSERTFFGNMIEDSNKKGGAGCMQGRLVSALVTFHTNRDVCGDGVQQPA